MYECMFIVLVCVHTKRCPHSSDGVRYLDNKTEKDSMHRVFKRKKM